MTGWGSLRSHSWKGVEPGVRLTSASLQGLLLKLEALCLTHLEPSEGCGSGHRGPGWLLRSPIAQNHMWRTQPNDIMGLHTSCLSSWEVCFQLFFLGSLRLSFSSHFRHLCPFCYDTTANVTSQGKSLEPSYSSPGTSHLPVSYPKRRSV